MAGHAIFLRERELELRTLIDKVNSYHDTSAMIKEEKFRNLQEQLVESLDYQVKQDLEMTALKKQL